MSKIIFQKKSGLSYHGDSLKLIKSNKFRKKYKGKINLIFTSPPFNLIYKKKYGNKYGQEYIDWLSEFSEPLSDLLTEDGSIVIDADAEKDDTNLFNEYGVDVLGLNDSNMSIFVNEIIQKIKFFILNK